MVCDGWKMRRAPGLAACDYGRLARHRIDGYGLQYPILRAVDEHPELDYLLLVSGAHLDNNFGRTLEEIRNDGFRIEAEVKIEMNADSRIATAQAIVRQ